MELQVGSEPMTLGSPTSPKPTSGAQFLPGFLMGDLPAPASPQPRPFSLASPIADSTSTHRGGGGRGSALQPVVPTPKDKSGAPPVRSIHDDLVTVATPLTAHRQPEQSRECSAEGFLERETELRNANRLSPAIRLTNEPLPQARQGHPVSGEIHVGHSSEGSFESHLVRPLTQDQFAVGQDSVAPGIFQEHQHLYHNKSFPVMQSPVSARQASTPGTGMQQMCLSPAQVDPFYTQGESLSSEDQLDQTWVTVFGFPPASASYILLQFAQYGNILKHTMASPGNWMHLQYQSRLQARKALSKDGKVFGDSIMVGVKPCIDKSVMDSSEAVSTPVSSSFASSILPSTPRSAIRPLSTTYRNSGSDYQVVADRQTPRKDDSFVSKAMEYMFGW